MSLTKSKSHPSTLVYYLLFVKWNFLFTLRNNCPADQPDHLLQPCMVHCKVTFNGYRTWENFGVGKDW